MVDLNRTERRALWLGALLFSLGAAARLGLGPGEAEWGWQPAGTEAGGVRDVQRAVRAGVERAEHAARPLAPDERVDPNTAPAVELERLPGIGPARARAILEERSRTGPFRSADELRRVPGIGPATVRRLEPHLAVPSGASLLPAVDGLPTANLPPPVRDGAAAPRTPGRPPPASLNLNAATAEDLIWLPGIGPELAGRILELRRRRGRFRSVDDLLAVRGIGPRTLERLRPRVTVR